MGKSKKIHRFGVDLPLHLSDTHTIVAIGKHIHINIVGLLRLQEKPRVLLLKWWEDAGVEIINLTPRNVTLLLEKETITVIASGKTARAAVKRDPIGTLNGNIPVHRVSFGAPVDLPDAESGKAYIVSEITARSAPDRHDLYCPDELVRDDEGYIIGCKGLM